MFETISRFWSGLFYGWMYGFTILPPLYHRTLIRRPVITCTNISWPYLTHTQKSQSLPCASNARDYYLTLHTSASQASGARFLGFRPSWPFLHGKMMINVINQWIFEYSIHFQSNPIHPKSRAYPLMSLQEQGEAANMCCFLFFLLHSCSVRTSVEEIQTLTSATHRYLKATWTLSSEISQGRHGFSLAPGFLLSFASVWFTSARSEFWSCAGSFMVQSLPHAFWSGFRFPWWTCQQPGNSSWLGPLNFPTNSQWWLRSLAHFSNWSTDCSPWSKGRTHSTNTLTHVQTRLITWNPISHGRQGPLVLVESFWTVIV